MRKVIFWTLGVLLALSTFHTQAATPTMNVGSFNIWCGCAETGDFPWTPRSVRIADLIRFHDYDVLGLQEVRHEQMATMRKLLPEYTFVGTGRDGVGQGEHSCVAFLKDRFALLDSGTFWLSETPDKVSLGWDAAYNRVCSWVKLRDNQSKKVFFYFNTHLDHMGPKARHNGAQLICDKIKELAGDKYPIFCSGDFNARPEEDPIVVMKSSFLSANEVCQTKPYVFGPKGWSWGGMPLPIQQKDYEVAQIDYVFLNDRSEVLKYGNLSDSDGKTFPSDHLPVWTRVRIK